MDKIQIDTIAHQLETVFDRMRQLHMEKHQQYRLKPSECNFLYLLTVFKKNQTIVPSDLAAKSGVTLGAITHHLNKLEADGYIKRKILANDRRSITIALTNKGRLAAKTIKLEKMKRVRGLIKYLGPIDSKNLAQLAEKISNYIKTQSEEKNRA